MDYKDYYATLGVGKKASPDEIQKAYRKLARKYHPDINKSAKAEVRFKEINEAYEVLKDPDKRARYDQFGSAWKQAQRTGGPPPGFEEIFSRFGGGQPVEFDLGSGGFSSFFEALFGSGRGADPFGGFHATGTRPRPQTADQEARIALSLEDAVAGGKREITLADPTTGQQRRLRVNLPAGLRPGQKIRLAGQGVKLPGGQRGDLYLTVETLPHPRLRVEGSDLYSRLPVAPWEAVLGGNARVSTLEGEVTVRIPPGSSSGRKIRLRGKGLPAGNGARGDLFAEIRIVVPEMLSDRERALYEELAQTSGFRPRAQAPIPSEGV